MSVTLENVTRTVDGIPTIRDVSLTLERTEIVTLLLRGRATNTAAAPLAASLEQSRVALLSLLQRHFVDRPKEGHSNTAEQHRPR